MREVPDGGDDFSGIDPQQLGDMTGSITSRTNQAQTPLNDWSGKANRIGLDTTRLTAISKDLGWAQQQVPMLNRRHTMAQAAAQQGGDPPGFMQTAGAGALDFPTQQAAQAAGSADGKKALQALQNHDGNTDPIAQELAAHSGDPDYMAAFFKALGPQGLALLGQKVNQDPAKNAGLASVVGSGLATASYVTPLTYSWLSQVQLPGQNTAGPNWDLLKPFLSQGVYSPATLQVLGKQALSNTYAESQGQTGDPETDQGTALIWEMMAHNPDVAAQFYKDNYGGPNGAKPNLYSIMQSPYNVGMTQTQAFADMVQAATIAPAGAPDISQFAANAQMTVRDFGQAPPVQPSGALRHAFGMITMNYFDDMATSVRAAAPGYPPDGAPGLNVSAGADEWGKFMQLAMGDKTTSAQLMTFYATWRNQQPVDWKGKGNEDIPEKQGFWNDFSLGVMDDFMASHYQAAGAKAGDSSEKIAEIAASGGAAFLTSLAFGPEAGVAEVLTEAASEGGKDAFQTAVEGTLSAAFKGDPEKPGNPDELLAQLTGVPNTWEGTVRSWYSGSGSAPSIDKVTYNGTTYDGSPDIYEKEYGGDFMDNGQLKPLEEIQKDPKALAAYNAWLQDPAIVNANGSAFRTTELGKLSSGYARSFAGGG